MEIAHISQINKLPLSKDFNSINKIQKSVSNTLKTSSSIIEPMDLEEVEFLILNDHHKL